jgi:20S proteasome subunit beta 1
MSSFAGRELLNPANVMEASYDAGTTLQQDNGLNFLGKEVDTGTTIMAVQYDGGVIVGADSRVSTGVYISNRASDKITAVDDRIYCCRSGSAADTQAVSDYVRYFLDQHRMEYGQPPKVATAANLFQMLCYQNKNMLTAGIIVAGWDKEKGGQVFALPIGGALMEREYATGGSGSTYIYGFCDAFFKPGMTKQQCEEFVTKGLCHAMARDGSSGGIIRMAIIDESGVERKFIAGDKLPYGPL